MKDLKEWYGIDLKETNNILQNLMMSALDLSEITDQPIDENGIIRVHYKLVAEKLFRIQWSVREIVSEFELYSIFVEDVLNGKYVEREVSNISQKTS